VAGAAGLADLAERRTVGRFLGDRLGRHRGVVAGLELGLEVGEVRPDLGLRPGLLGALVAPGGEELAGALEALGDRRRVLADHCCVEGRLAPSDAREGLHRFADLLHRLLALGDRVPRIARVAVRSDRREGEGQADEEGGEKDEAEGAHGVGFSLGKRGTREMPRTSHGPQRLPGTAAAER
jgi:hypothetical protein